MSPLSLRDRRDLTAFCRIDPVKIRLGKTGAFFKVDGQEEVMTFSVLVITWARHFDLLGYITVGARDTCSHRKC